tara:strand:+ start:269 stop:514 length:246 start_codon:yes stop_codon:yes gene_type:complete
MKLEQEELDKIVTAKDRFSKLKDTLGDLEITKQEVLDEIRQIRRDFLLIENSLIEKYGSDSTINMTNGEITKKDTQPLQKV